MLIGSSQSRKKFENLNILNLILPAVSPFNYSIPTAILALKMTAHYHGPAKLRREPEQGEIKEGNYPQPPPPRVAPLLLFF